MKTKIDGDAVVTALKEYVFPSYMCVQSQGETRVAFRVAQVSNQPFVWSQTTQGCANKIKTYPVCTQRRVCPTQTV